VPALQPWQAVPAAHPAPEALLYPSPAEVTSLPAHEVGPFIVARLTEHQQQSVPDLERVLGLGQLARRLDVDGMETILAGWLAGHATAQGHDTVGLFLMGYWPTRPRVSRLLVDRLVDALRTHADEIGVRDSAVFALRIAYEIHADDMALAGRIREAFRPLWPGRNRMQAGVQKALAHVLGPSGSMKLHWTGYVQALMYGVQFDRDPTLPTIIERAVKIVIERDRENAPGDYLQAIETALGSSRDLAKLLPQPHCDQVVRRFLGSIAEDLRAR
jgi:hypothetical protein